MLRKEVRYTMTRLHRVGLKARHRTCNKPLRSTNGLFSVAGFVHRGDSMELALHEKAELEQHEANIERGLKTFIDVGNSLIAIRDQRLYRQDYSTFEEYCQKRWGMSRPRAYQLMGAAEVVGNLSTNVYKPQIEAHIRPLTGLDPNQQREAWEEALATAPGGNVTGRHVAEIAERFKERSANDTATEEKARPHVSHNSGENEWYTPSEYIEAARFVMGDIDLDPASSDLANETVKATTYFTILDDGLTKRWYGRVWMNPPYSQPEINHFSQKMVESIESGEVQQACVLVNNATETGWFQALLTAASAICFPKSRIRFLGPNGEKGAPLQGQAILYFGERVSPFAAVFSEFGHVMEPYHELR